MCVFCSVAEEEEVSDDGFDLSELSLTDDEDVAQIRRRLLQSAPGECCLLFVCETFCMSLQVCVFTWQGASSFGTSSIASRIRQARHMLRGLPSCPISENHKIKNLHDSYQQMSCI
jgi:hypothetical protein